ncbi:MAG: hypothetical protein JNJ85_00945, partial [Candidatus Kapabacteria bacterium]|nr:hypothetical protein [Candidatus Kapabacteria bacterium]
TNKRTFIDYGDDNRDGVISEDQNLINTEKLINNVDYFYRLLAYDQGDVFQGTPGKLNSGVENVNIQHSYPLSSVVKSPSVVSNAQYDSTLIGGLYNFRLIVKDQDRFNTLFGGHEIEVLLKPSMNATLAYTRLDSLYYGSSIPTQPLKGMYQTELTITDKTTNEKIGNYIVNYESRDCSFQNLPSEWSLVWMSPDQPQYLSLTDTSSALWKSITGNFAHPINNTIANFSGSYTTDKTCNFSERLMKGTIGFAFDYTLQQFGGIFRPYEAKVTNGDANVAMYRDTVPSNVKLTRFNATSFDLETFNQGPGVYEIEFLPGGTEDITTSYSNDPGNTTHTYKVPYLNMRIKNVYSYKRADPKGDSITIAYGQEIKHKDQQVPVQLLSVGQNKIDTTTQAFPDATLVPIGMYNISAFGWRNGRSVDGNSARNNQAMQKNTGAPVGTQGRYYLSTIDGSDTLDFCHFIHIDGTTFCLDFSGKGGRKGGFGGRIFDKPLTDATRIFPKPTSDFEANDKITLTTFGGCFGLPREGAKVTFKVSESKVEANNITDDLLEQIQVVPNPYIISHYGQRSGYDAKLYFTKLPKECTIKIFTVAGDLIRTIKHIDLDGTYQQGMDVWDLLSDNKQRAASQGLIAVIETPNGAKTIKKFSIVVGSSQIFR